MDLSLLTTPHVRKPQWRHARRADHSAAGRAPGWSGPNGVYGKQAIKQYKQLIDTDIAAAMPVVKLILMLIRAPVARIYGNSPYSQV